MGRAAGSTGTMSFLPSLPAAKKVLTPAQHAREFPIDQDRDGVSDAFDDDIDGTGGKNEADPADNVWGIPDEFLVRTPFVAGPVTTDKPAPAWSSCFKARESIPRFMTITAAAKFRLARRCIRFGGSGRGGPGQHGASDHDRQRHGRLDLDGGARHLVRYAGSDLQLSAGSTRTPPEAGPTFRVPHRRRT